MCFVIMDPYSCYGIVFNIVSILVKIVQPQHLIGKFTS